MCIMAKQGGWAGSVLRVDLSSGKISTEGTVEKYRDYLGGTGIGYKVLWDEVLAGTKPFDPENKVVFATGPWPGPAPPATDGPPSQRCGRPAGPRRWSRAVTWAAILPRS
jgi:hypothetical protein